MVQDLKKKHNNKQTKKQLFFFFSLQLELYIQFFPVKSLSWKGLQEDEKLFYLFLCKRGLGELITSKVCSLCFHNCLLTTLHPLLRRYAYVRQKMIHSLLPLLELWVNPD